MNALPRAPTHDPGNAPRSLAEIGRAVAAAAEQIDLALREAEAPVARFGESVATMIEGFFALREALEAAAAGAPQAADPGEIAAGLQAQVATAMEHAQCFDRLFQHLSHLRDFLTGIAGRLDTDLAAAAGDGGWEALCAGFRARLLTPEQRALLDRMLPAGTGSGPEDAAPRGSIELF